MSTPMFSSSMFAVPAAPRSQPARVYATHGAGAIFPPGVTIVGALSDGFEVTKSKMGAVQ
jgi:hypothetical protein